MKRGRRCAIKRNISYPIIIRYSTLIFPFRSGITVPSTVYLQIDNGIFKC